MPGAFDDGAQYSVLGLGQSGKLVAVKAIKRGTGALEHCQAFNARLDVKRKPTAVLSSRDDFCIPRLIAVLLESMRMWLAIHSESGPSVYRDVRVCFVNVRVCREEVIGENRCEFLGGGEG